MYKSQFDQRYIIHALTLKTIKILKNKEKGNRGAKQMMKYEMLNIFSL